MRLSDFLFFLKQLCFPHWKSKEEHVDSEGEPSRFAIYLDRFGKRLRQRDSVSTVTSLLLHAIVLLTLSLIFLPGQRKGIGIDIFGGTIPPDVQSEDVAIIPGTPNTSEERAPRESDAPTEQQQEEVVPTKQPDPATSEENVNVAAIEEPVNEQGERPVGGTPQVPTGSLVGGGGYEGRTPEGRGRSIGVGDSSVGGENAVEAALAWLAAHQIRGKDNPLQGSWCFNLEESCSHCSRSGTHESRIAATSLALLPFLGAGYTHEGGKYKKVVEDGLFFLLVRARETSSGAAFNQGTQGMYSHGIATMVLCEAYAMSKSKPKKLGHTAQEAIRFIEEAQDRRTGGWRYTPNESPGDLSASVWQVMALKSGKLAGLHVSQPTIYEAILFLDTVQMEGGRKYNYLPDFGLRGKGEDSPITCNAMGILTRMYLGWKPGDRMLDGGMEMVRKYGPLKENGRQCNLYFAYYATLAMHHHDGSGWRNWNNEIRDFLVRTQSSSGHEAGSWFFPDYYCDSGGRLLNTVLATLILETPYRIMPLFRRPGEFQHAH